MSKNSPSLGSEQLAASGTISVVAKTLGVADRTVAGWRAGKAPNRASLESIERLLGIPTVAWSRVAGPAAAPTSPATALAAATKPMAPGARQTAEERLREQLERLRAQREIEGLTERSRVELEKLELQASARLARLEGASGLTERQIMASPHLARYVDVMIAALRPHPIAFFDTLNAVNIFQDRAPDDHLGRTEKEHPAEVQAVRDANAALLTVMQASAKRAA
jgi:hypothetical protein